jgi:hypothetical protein
MLTLYDYADSGNTYKARLLLAQLGLDYRSVELDIDKGETRTPEFLAKNPNGRVPALELEDGTVLAESNAIICYLADGTPYWPAERVARARVLQWLFFEQYSHEPYVATPRYIIRHLGRDHAPRRGAAGPHRARPPGAQGDGNPPRRPRRSSSRSATRSPTSRSTPTPMSRTRPTSTSRAIRACAPGSPASRASRAT